MSTQTATRCQSVPRAPMHRTGAPQAAPTRMPLDVYETEDALVVKASLPGCDKERIEISFREGRLGIRASREPLAPPQNGRVRLQEQQAGDLSRSLDIRVPLDAEKATATYEDGVLTLTLPKAQPAHKHRIQIQ